MKPAPDSIRRIFAVVTGLVFFTAGMLKLMDPVGASLVVHEYLQFLHLEFLDFLSYVAGAGLALVETLTGLALVTGVFRKIAAIVTSAFLGFFTLLTLALWIVNPEMDCGCFGEAIHLTHAQSFLKNVLLCIFAMVAFLPYKDFGKPGKKKYVGFALVGILSVFMLIRSALFIPFTDFTPFSISSRIAAAEVTESADGEDMYEATFVYEKNGVQETFTLDDLPDSTWTFVRTDTKLRQDVSAPESGPALSFSDQWGNYLDEIATGPLVMVLSSYRPSSLDSESWSKIAQCLSSASDRGFTALLMISDSHEAVLSSLPDELDPSHRELIESSLFFSDYKTLISLNRSNGGASFFSDGILIQRWPLRNLPSESRLDRISEDDSMDVMLTASTKGRLSYQASFLLSYLLMLLF